MLFLLGKRFLNLNIWPLYSCPIATVGSKDLKYFLKYNSLKLKSLKSNKSKKVFSSTWKFNILFFLIFVLNELSNFRFA